MTGLAPVRPAPPINAHARPAAGDATLAGAVAAVVVERCETGQRCCLLTADLTQLWHPNDQSERGPQADAGNGQHEGKTTGEVVVGAQGPGEAGKLGPATALQPLDVVE